MVPNLFKLKTSTYYFSLQNPPQGVELKKSQTRNHNEKLKLGSKLTERANKHRKGGFAIP